MQRQMVLMDNGLSKCSKAHGMLNTTKADLQKLFFSYLQIELWWVFMNFLMKLCTNIVEFYSESIG